MRKKRSPRFALSIALIVGCRLLGLRILAVAPLLGMTLYTCGLVEEEALRLACAFGDIGGDEALSLLNRLERVTPLDRTRVLKEIKIARELLQSKRLPGGR